MKKSKPFLFKYTRVGTVCFVEADALKKLYKALKTMGVEAKDVKPKKQATHAKAKR